MEQGERERERKKTFWRSDNELTYYGLVVSSIYDMYQVSLSHSL